MIKKIQNLGKERILEGIFDISYILFLVSVMINSSKYSMIDEVKIFSHIGQILSCLIALCKIGFDFNESFKRKEGINYKKAFIILVMIISTLITGSKTLVYLAIFIIAAKDIDFNKIAKITLKVQTLILIFTIVSCKFGIIDDLVVYREMKQRHALGTASPNCLMLQMFQIVMLYVYVKGKDVKIFDLSVLLGLSLIIYSYTDSRMGMISIIFAILVAIILKYFNIEKITNKLKFLIKYGVIALALGYIILTILYKPFNLVKINQLLSNRLELSSEALSDYNITLFGNKIKWIGQLTEEENIGEEYNYIDSSYLNILLNYGIILLIYSVYCMTSLTSYGYKEKQYLLIFLILIIELYCFFDSWLIGIQFNTFLFLLNSKMYPFLTKDRCNSNERNMMYNE